MFLSPPCCQHLALADFVPPVKTSQRSSPYFCVTGTNHFTEGHFLKMLANIPKGKFIQLCCNTRNFVPQQRLSGDKKGPPRPLNISQGAGEV